MTSQGREKVVYLAGPLFSLAERHHNLRVAEALRGQLPELRFLLPQERAESVLPDLSAVVDQCFQDIREADFVVACLDGSDADSGTCIEIGYAIALEKRVIGYRTDFRGSEVDGVNAMIRYGCSVVINLAPDSRTFDRLVDRLSLELRTGC